MYSLAIKEPFCAICAVVCLTVSGVAVAQLGPTVERQPEGSVVGASPGDSTTRQRVDTAEETEPPATVNPDPLTERDDADVAVDRSAVQRTRSRNRNYLADPTMEDDKAFYFSEVDYSNDYRLTWDEINAYYHQEILEGGWDRMEFFEEFDSDGDEFLDEEEYLDFIRDIGLEEQENRSPFIEVD